MIIFNISGGLGNQFFQYAFGRTLSTKLNNPLYLDFTSYTTDPARKPKLSYFNTEYLQAPTQQAAEYKSTYNALHSFLKKQYRKDAFVKWKTYFTDKVEMGYRKNIINAHRGYFDGYWGNEKYFKAISDVLRREFTIKEAYKTAELNGLVSLARNTNSVAVHIRRGDYVQNERFSRFFNSLPISYYTKAIHKISQNVSDSKFFIFSDDIPWVQENIPKDSGYEFVFIDRQLQSEDYLEFALMRECRHFIIANSTFSWWAAWLGSNDDNIIIAPANWYADPNYQSRFEKDSFIPNNWTLFA